MGKPLPGTCLVCRLGLVSFPEAMDYEHALIKLRFEEKIGDALLLFEHPPTVTLGRSGNIENVLISPLDLAQKGIAYYDSDRAGDATFNCPGQLIIHPIMDIRKRTGILRGYVTDLEEVVIRVLGDFGISGERWPEHHGIWVNQRQISAIGMRIARGISMHGLSLNVNPDLESFKVINLCGLPGKSATSMAAELGHDVALSEVISSVRRAFARIFQVDLLDISIEELNRECRAAAASGAV